jgi:hypothetical protein
MKRDFARYRRRFAAVFLFLILTGLLPGRPKRASANTISAASPSLADVRSAISSAAAGDTVLVPAGSAVWTGQIVLTKGINLIGAGIGLTNIIGNFTPTGNYQEPGGFLICYNPANPALDQPFRLSGFTINFGAKSRGVLLYNDKGLPISPLTKIRIDHCDLSNPLDGDMLILAFGHVYGCIDQNVLTGGYFMLRCFGNDYESWVAQKYAYGDANNLYFEDNVINCTDAFVEAGAGGRYCFRRNVVNFSGTGGIQIMDMHGNTAASHASTMGGEIYDNVIYAPRSDSGGELIQHRGGRLICYNNTLVCRNDYFTVHAREEARDSDNPPAFSPDGQPQHVSDSYYFNNKSGTTLSNAAPIAIGQYSIIETVNYNATPVQSPYRIVPQWNLDCWRQTTPFTGASGVGVGLLADRPATCTTGVGYWATDTNTLYRATATNTWTAYYRPYAYPHPLTFPLSMLSPIGGETWPLGSNQTISWLSNAYSGPVSLSLLRDGAKVLDIGTAQASDGSLRWTVPATLTPASTYTIMITGGSFLDVSKAPFSILQPASIQLSPSSLRFVSMSLLKTLSRNVALSNAGGGVLDWTASSSQPWLAVSPAAGVGDTQLTISVNPAGLKPGVHAGSIAVSDPADPNSPHYIFATLIKLDAESNPRDEPEPRILAARKSFGVLSKVP